MSTHRFLAIALFAAGTTIAPAPGHADAPFAADLQFEALLGSTPSGVAIGDFNRDGLPDFAACGGDSVAILLGDGRGGMAPRKTYATAALPFALGVADFNQDGFLDLAIPSQNAVTVLL